MKIKKLFFALSLFGVLFGIDKLFCEGAELQSIKKLEAEIQQDTPLQFAAKSLSSNFNCGHFDDQFGAQGIGYAASGCKTEVFNQSFSRYIKDIYNKPDYFELLSLDGTHVVEFLKLCNELCLNANSVYVGMRLFRIKMMSCEIIDDTVVLSILDELPGLVSRFFKKSGKDELTEDYLSKNIEKIILGYFNDQFLNCNATNLEFTGKNIVKDVSKFVFNELKKNKNKKVAKKDKNRLRFEIIRFFETTISRMLWNPKAPETVWPSFLSLANGLQTLAANKIINHMDDLDGLLWELLHRFNFFLDLSGFCLPMSIYEEIEQALTSGSVFFLEIGEQDEGVTPKKEILASKLLSAKTKAYAYQRQGIMPAI